MISFRCKPSCVGCWHGRCSSPNKCDCDLGYKWDVVHAQCVPICRENCLNGKCIAPEQCECNSGYHFANGMYNICEPFCEVTCKNAKCVSPNVCKCNDCYKVFNQSQSHICHPICNPNSKTKDDGCINGTCIAPNICQCNNDFELDLHTNFTCISLRMNTKIQPHCNIWLVDSFDYVLSIFFWSFLDFRCGTFCFFLTVF